MNVSAESVFPEKYRILSGSTLKVIAVVTMLIDHIGAVLLSMYQPALKTLFTLFGREYSVYLIFRDIGRVAFPIFCFLLLEGFLHTHDRFRYGMNLFIFSLISEIPWNLMFTNTLRYEKQNVFFTLFLGYLAFCAIEHFQDEQTMQLFCILGLLAVSVFLKADYGWRGYIFLLSMYYMRNDKPGQATWEAAGSIMNGGPVSLFCPLTCTMEKEDLSAEKRRNTSSTGFIRSIL